MTDGLGVDVAIEAVGIPDTFQACTRSCAPAGRSPTSACTALRSSCPCRTCGSWTSSITMGLVSTSTTPMLLKLVAQHKLAAEKFATHHFELDQMLEAYDTFGRAAETKALKVILNR